MFRVGARLSQFRCRRVWLTVDWDIARRWVQGGSSRLRRRRGRDRRHHYRTNRRAPIGASIQSTIISRRLSYRQLLSAAMGLARSGRLQLQTTNRARRLRRNHGLTCPHRRCRPMAPPLPDQAQMLVVRARSRMSPIHVASGRRTEISVRRRRHSGAGCDKVMRFVRGLAPLVSAGGVRERLVVTVLGVARADVWGDWLFSRLWFYLLLALDIMAAPAPRSRWFRPFRTH